ncbi:MAG TPA: sulfotransferase domain-containing protein [Arenicellales bacterium]|nr:sulfotransferase domain-containing protein [Arenicellales bacterium]
MNRDWRATLRLVTAPARMMPSFIIPGEAKCGTTSLYRYLTQHPEILPAQRKEPRTFVDYPGSRLRCASSYPLVTTGYLHSLKSGRRCVTGEATAEYLSRPWVAEAVAELAPTVKLIVLLRNPATRAVSDYQMLYERGLVDIDFETAVRRTLDWLQNPELSDLVDAASQNEHFYTRFVMRGLYARSLRPWITRFSRQNILVLKSEDMFANPAEVVQKAFEHLGVRPWTIRSGDIKRKGVYTVKITPDILKRLAEFYEPYNLELYDLLGMDFEWENENYVAAARN